MTAATASAPSRLRGLDLFRAVAVFGMLVAHVGPAAWLSGEGLGTVRPEWELFHSRMPAMFAFAAGLSLNLGSRSARTLRSDVVPTVVRAGLLVLCGLGLTALGTPAAVILAYFGVWFLLALPLRALRARTLFLVAGAWALLGPVLSFLLRSAVDIRGNVLWTWLVSGDYPTLTWMPFVVAGLAVGRLDLHRRRVRLALGVAGATLTALAYGLSALFLAAGGVQRIAAALPPMAGQDDLQRFAAVFFAESGVVDTSTWLWLLTPAPHSGSWADVLGCLGVCALLLALLLPVGDKITASLPSSAGWPRRAAATVLTAVAAMGAMVLSVYAAHIVAMALITAVTGHSFAGPQSVLTLAAFTVALIVFAAVWTRRFGRGPLEAALARATSLIVRTGTRASGGSSRR